MVPIQDNTVPAQIQNKIDSLQTQVTALTSMLQDKQYLEPLQPRTMLLDQTQDPRQCQQKAESDAEPSLEGEPKPCTKTPPTGWFVH